MQNLPTVEILIALFDTAVATLCFALGCAVVVAAMPPELVAGSEPVSPSFDVAVPAWGTVDAPTLVVAAGR